MKRLEQIVELVKDVLKAIEHERRGRPHCAQQGCPPTYPTSNMLLIFLLKSLKNWSVNHTYNKLTDEVDATWRSLLGLTLDDLPSRRWLNELETHPRLRRLRDQVHRRLLRRLLDQVDLKTLAVDLTDVPVHPEWDELTNWGYTSDDEAFYGYKVHVLYTGDGLPLAVRVTRANGHELNEVGPLLKQTNRLLGSSIAQVDHVLGDAAYDANAVYDDAVAYLEASFQADANRRNADVSDKEIQQMTPEIAKKLATHPRRQQALLERYSDTGKERHKQRTIAEELFGILKTIMPGFTDLSWWQAGIRRVRHHFRWVFFAFVSVLARNLDHDEPMLAIKMSVT